MDNCGLSTVGHSTNLRRGAYNAPHYDIDFDRNAIEASFAKQYGIRLSQEDIAVGEFLRLLSGLMPDTPLGQLVAARMATPTTPHERQIRREWALFKSGQGDIAHLQQMLGANFG